MAIIEGYINEAYSSDTLLENFDQFISIIESLENDNINESFITDFKMSIDNFKSSFSKDKRKYLNKYMNQANEASDTLIAL